MTFDVASEAYDGYMGRFSVPLAELFAESARLPPDGPVLDVGCGTGALTAVLTRRYGEAEVAAVDPSPTFVEAVTRRFPAADVRHGRAEALPFEDDTFTATLAELVVHFLSDAPAGLREMVRVTRPGGVVAACVWDYENERQPPAVFLRAASAESGRSDGPPKPGTRRGELAALLRQAGCVEVTETELTVAVDLPSFDEWWEPHTWGIGSTASALDGLDEAGVERVRERARAVWGDGPIVVHGTAWSARGITPHRS